MQESHGKGSASSLNHDDGPGPLSSEEFLFHMYRGAELLEQNRVHEAKEEIEGALRLQPSDPKGQDLMAVTYFRMGMYPRAIVLYEDLVAQFPDQVTPRVNLSLCYLKTGQADRALDHLQLVVDRHPEHERAWAYLGLVHERLRDFERARVCFERAGNKRMVRRMIDMATGDPKAGVRLAAAEAFHELDEGEIEFSLAADFAPGDGGSWEALKRPSAPPAAPVRDLLPKLVFNKGITRSGNDLLVRVEKGFAVRLDRVCAFGGNLPLVECVPLKRHARGRSDDLPLGSSARPVIVNGATWFVMRPIHDRMLRMLELDNDIACLREELLVGLDTSLSYENGRLPVGEGESSGVVRLRGTGSAIADFPVDHHSVPVEASVMVRHESILGWVGRLVPRPVSDEFVAFSGEGAVWVGGG